MPMRTHIADMPMITMLVPRDLAVFELESMVHLLIRRYLHIRMLMNAGILIDDAAIRITNRKVILDFLSISRPITSILKIPTDRRPAWGCEFDVLYMENDMRSSLCPLQAKHTAQNKHSHERQKCGFENAHRKASPDNLREILFPIALNHLAIKCTLKIQPIFFKLQFVNYRVFIRGKPRRRAGEYQRFT